MGNVAHYAAACARYYAMADVGYSQPDRWTFYDRSDWDGWLVRSPANADCSALVSGCYNIAAHHEWGEPFTAGYFPRDTWTGNIREYALERNFADISDSWVGNVPTGGWYAGDIVLSEGASGGRGHVAMIINGGSGPDSDGALLAEAWIAEDGSIDGWEGDQTGDEVRIIAYNDHPYTQQAAWTHALRRRDNPSPLTTGTGGSAAAPAPAPSGGESVQAAVLRAADDVGLHWAVALGLADQESNCTNVYGHDAGGACSGWGEVTRDNFLNHFLPAVLDWETSNGVGPTQVTYNGYFINEPDRAWWDPHESSVVGLSILRDYLGGDYSADSIRRAGSRYNCGNESDQYWGYGESLLQHVNSWWYSERPSGGSTEDEVERIIMANGDDIVNAINAVRGELRYGKANERQAGDVIWGVEQNRLLLTQVVATQKETNGLIKELVEAIKKGK